MAVSSVSEDHPHGIPTTILVEIKPATTAEEYRAPIPKIVAGIGDRWNHDVLILGASAVAGLGDYPSAGLAVDFLHDRTDWNASRAWWVHCSVCGTAGVAIEGQDGLARPCGHTDVHQVLSAEAVTGLWKSAGNLVQWRAA